MNPRRVALDILVRAESSDRYIDEILHQTFNRWDGESRDKRFVQELVFGVIRWKKYLDYYLSEQYRGRYDKAEYLVQTLLRIGLYQLTKMDSVPKHAALNETVALAKQVKNKRVAGLVNGVLRGILRNFDSLDAKVAAMDPPERLSIRESHPLWLVERWVDRYSGGEAQALCQWDNKTPNVTVRVNTTRISTDEFRSHLIKQGIDYSPSKYLPEFFILEQAQDVLQNNLFDPGWYAIQGEGAGLATSLVQPDPGDVVLDVCAAPGGKSTYLAQKFNSSNKMLAYDINPNRLKKINSLTKRLQLNNIRVAQADAAEDDFPNAKWILVDAPCTGTGVLDRRADARWNRESDGPERMATLQNRILQNIVRSTIPGGYIIYSTCSLEPEENWETIDRFLEQNPEFVVTTLEDTIPEKLIDSRGALMVEPHRHSMDGAFAVRLRREK